MTISKDTMLNIFQFFSKLPSLQNLDLKRYFIDYSLNRLVFGVDNIHFDVYISPQACKALKRTAYLLMIKHSRSEHFFSDYKRELCEIEKDTLRRVCTDVLLDGIGRAKVAGEVQIDLLAQAALAKMFLEEIKNQYKKILAYFEPLVRIYQLSQQHDHNEVFRIKDKIADIKLHQNRILRLVGEELFALLADIQSRNLRNMRETHFHPQDILPDNFFINPILHTENHADDLFLIEEYVLLGQRSEDPDNYESVKLIINELLGKTDLVQNNTQDIHPTGIKESKEKKAESFFDAEVSIFDLWIMDEGNFDRMLNCFDAQEQYERAKEAKEFEDVLRKLQEQIKTRQKLLNLFYRKFKKARLLRQIVAAFEMKSVYGNYCPPMLPRQIREFLVDFWARKSITRQLKRRKSVQGKLFSLAPLQQTLQRINRITPEEKKRHLLMFLKQISRYSRDLCNCRILRDAMDAINLATEEKIILLSRGNRSLFEFLLQDEHGKEEKPVSHHVILKADIRGSMDINSTMRTRGLNPASYFSLNFFDPISAILAEYDAAKVFIEGDAIILSIFEKKDFPQNCYTVARACGMAIRILQIVQRYNVKNKENNLPILELGIGISASAGPPAYLFDGDSRIMISPAINQADRLSSCDKKLRKRLKNKNPLFNLFVFKNDAEEETEDTADEFYLRFNVNGIELSVDGFNKLAKEIKLKKISYAADKNEKVKLYTGKVPTVNGNYQNLAIREAIIYELNAETMDVTAETARKYYEVCTSQEIYDFIDNPT
jgi:hypothetical protein